MNDPDKELYALARELVESRTLTPAYLADDEAWYTAVEDARATLGIPEKAPVCPHCGSVAPYGDGRNQWIDAHNSVFHRLYYDRIKNIQWLRVRKH